MRRYVINYAWLPIIFLIGCGTTSHEKLRDIDRRVMELSNTTQTLGKKIDDLSRSISLIVLDGNELHNEMDDVKVSGKNTQQKIEGVEIAIKNLDDHNISLETNHKALEEDFNKRIDDIQKTEIELSNRLEIMKLDRKDGVKEKTESQSVP